MTETGRKRVDIGPWQTEFGLSNADLGRLLDVHETMISRWRSTRRVPGPAVAYMRLYREHETLKARLRELGA